jgi:NADPH:quinone reductase-like Zn-dependent oxidoreductase
VGLDNLALAERPVPRPAAGQVLVRIRATSLNFRDLLVARGQYPLSELRYPLVPLADGAGEVVEVGPEVRRLRPGDRVVGSFFQTWIDGPPDAQKHASALGAAIDGVLAEHVVFQEGAAIRFPEHLSFEQAATLPCAGVTVWVSLVVHGQLQAGQTVLAMGTGGVSVFALQVAKTLGARVILTSSSDEKLARGKALGADETINYRRTPDWDARARELTGGRGVDHILEVGGAETLPRSLRALRDGGHITLVGVLGGAPGDLGAVAKEDRGIRAEAVYVGSARELEALCAFMGRTGLEPVVDRTFPFEEARAAYELQESAGHFGKVVIRV